MSEIYPLLLAMPVISFISSVFSYCWLCTITLKIPHHRNIKAVQIVNIISQTCVFASGMAEKGNWNDYAFRSFQFVALSGFLFNFLTVGLINLMVLEKFAILDSKINPSLIKSARVVWICCFGIIYPLFVCAFVMGILQLSKNIPYYDGIQLQIWFVAFLISWPILVLGIIQDNIQSIFLVRLVYKWRTANTKNSNNENDKNYTIIVRWLVLSLCADWIGVLGAAYTFIGSPGNSMLIYHPILGIHSSIMAMVVIYMTRLTFQGQRLVNPNNLIKAAVFKQSKISSISAAKTPRVPGTLNHKDTIQQQLQRTDTVDLPKA
jgi:hypothetical protein